jgi:hypothetical protein
MAADVTETITEIVPHQGMTMAYFTGTKAAATDYVTFGDFRQIYYAAAVTGAVGSAGADDPVTAITTNVVTFSVGTGAIRGFVLGVR